MVEPVGSQGGEQSPEKVEKSEKTGQMGGKKITIGKGSKEGVDLEKLKASAGPIGESAGVVSDDRDIKRATSESTKNIETVWKKGFVGISDVSKKEAEEVEAYYTKLDAQALEDKEKAKENLESAKQELAKPIDDSKPDQEFERLYDAKEKIESKQTAHTDEEKQVIRQLEDALNKINVDEL